MLSNLSKYINLVQQDKQYHVYIGTKLDIVHNGLILSKLFGKMKDSKLAI